MALGYMGDSSKVLQHTFYLLEVDIYKIRYFKKGLKYINNFE
jgi:hypothetical protein